MQPGRITKLGGGLRGGGLAARAAPGVGQPPEAWSWCGCRAVWRRWLQFTARVFRIHGGRKSHVDNFQETVLRKVRKSRSKSQQ